MGWKKITPPWTIVYHDGDKHLTLVLDKEKLSIDEASDLAHQLSYFVQEMDPGVEWESSWG